MKFIKICLIINLLILQTTNAKVKCLGELKNTFNNDRRNFKVVRDRYKKYRKYSRSDIFSRKKRDLLNKIEFWSRVAERDIRLKHQRKAQIRSFILEALHLDHQDALVLGLRPLFYRVQHSFYSLKRFDRLEAGFSKIKQKVENQEYEAANNALKKLVKKEGYYFEVLRRDIELSSTSVRALEQEMLYVENRKIDQLIQILENIDTYTEAKTILQNPPEASLKEKADFALDALEGSRAMENFRDMVGKTKEFEAPTVEELLELVTNNPMIEVIHLQKELKQERWTSVVSRLSPHQLHELFDMIVAKIPWLNKPSVRSYVRFAIDNKDILTYYPNIDRLVNQGTNEAKQMWDYLLAQDARDRGMDNFLLTFARRVDVRETWRELVQYSKTRSEQLKQEGIESDLEINMYERLQMIQQKAKQLPNLPPWHHPPESNLVRFMLDGIFLLGVGYGGHYVTTNWLSAWNEEQAKNKKPELAIPVLPTNNGTPTEGSTTPSTQPTEAKPSTPESGNHPAAGREITPVTPVKPAPRSSTPTKPVVIKDKEGNPLVELNILVNDAKN